MNVKKVISYLLICITLLTTTLVVLSSDIQRITPEKYGQSFIDTIEPNSGIRTFETMVRILIKECFL